MCKYWYVIIFLSNFRNWDLDFSTNYDGKCSESHGDTFTGDGDKFAMTGILEPGWQPPFRGPFFENAWSANMWGVTSPGSWWASTHFVIVVGSWSANCHGYDYSQRPRQLKPTSTLTAGRRRRWVRCSHRTYESQLWLMSRVVWGRWARCRNRTHISQQQLMYRR